MQKMSKGLFGAHWRDGTDGSGWSFDERRGSLAWGKSREPPSTTERRLYHLLNPSCWCDDT